MKCQTKSIVLIGNMVTKGIQVRYRKRILFNTRQVIVMSSNKKTLITRRNRKDKRVQGIQSNRKGLINLIQIRH
jgi:hypothetical protein